MKVDKINLLYGVRYLHLNCCGIGPFPVEGGGVRMTLLKLFLIMVIL